MTKKYKCRECEKIIKGEYEEPPECCDEPMEEVPLDVCTQPAQPEHARPMRDDEPCDDGRGG
ncbi:MAG: hypothetical protein V5A64_06435 [Candidatus Thermoplasmatota archaeon]